MYSKVEFFLFFVKKVSFLFSKNHNFSANYNNCLTFVTKNTPTFKTTSNFCFKYVMMGDDKNFNCLLILRMNNFYLEKNAHQKFLPKMKEIFFMELFLGAFRHKIVNMFRITHF